jgi:hypothetical protein
LEKDGKRENRKKGDEMESNREWKSQEGNWKIKATQENYMGYFSFNAKMGGKIESMG